MRHCASSVSAGASGWSSPSIQKSHERSEKFGLNASMRPDYNVLTDGELRMKLEQNHALCVHATPIMETLREQIVNTQSMIVLTDAQGLILHSIGDDDFLQRAEKVALKAGANWAEEQQGTNAIGTAIADRCPTVVHGDQHYLAANSFLTCSSVPILDPYGDLAGVLDVTGDHRSYHQHTMALAKMSVQMIENHLFANTFRNTLQIAFHGRPEFLGTLMEGLMAFTCDGRFLSANRSAQFQFGLPLAALRAHTLSSLFGLTTPQLIDRFRASQGHPVSLELNSGAVVCASMEFRRPTPAEAARLADAFEPAARPAVRHAQPARPASVEGSPSRLASLETGDPQVCAVVAKVRKVIGKNIPILITGETGTGKELLAQAIHYDSPRRTGPFVAVNCASIPENLIESELFGYEEGAFTGARRKGAVGKLLQADGGTLFLDEIGDMPYPLQVRLLRVLQERVVDPLGSSKSVPVDVAIICATHRNLREMIVQNRFREDLYYRLNGLVVKLPPLRERTDLAVVVEKMLVSARPDQAASTRLSVSDDVMALFQQCSWPGNFRQLGNLLRTAAAMVDDDGQIRREHLPDDFFEDLHRGIAAPGQRSACDPMQLPGARLQDVQASAIAAAVARHNGNVSAAARMLGISRNTVYRKMPSLGAGGVRDVDDISENP
ncbi:sigma-54-dependent Fis family transcriptional regulator [Paraburkholderia sp. LEh10]|uniref:sigma-54-dependent Fis family transcriptional regulator n=1 Tax=Paraburkholderia sp. LEh10 TaxID=2821353 RepID=UPI001AE91C3C|nr:sigma-54-dependent Fis family transcriptional regulator [Paraburkholderia sp. LEh10]MBP0590329.1 sigma-54-dependent Fis family transcriptional regulator [Paraburkholderia sp. LEh10]